MALIGGLRSFLSSMVAPPPGSATAAPGAGAAATPATTAATTRPPAKPYGQIWLTLSDEPRYPVSELRDTYARACACADREPTARDRVAFDAIERDVARTFGGIGKFDSQRARDRLRRVLGAYAMHDPEVGYTQGMNFLAGFALLYVEDEADAFALLVRIMHSPRYHMRGLYLHDLPDVGVTSFCVKHLLWKHAPELASHLEVSQGLEHLTAVYVWKCYRPLLRVKPYCVLPQPQEVGCEPIFFFEWYFTLFTYVLPPAMCAEVRGDRGVADISLSATVGV